MSRLEIDFLGSAKSDIDDIRTTVNKTLGNGAGQHWTVEPNVASHYNLLGLKYLAKGAPNTIGDIVIKLVWHTPTDVISLEAPEHHISPADKPANSMFTHGK
jgi:hypothetical protein